MYLREAKRIFELKVYQCILGGDEIEEIKRFFTSSILVGIFAEAEVIRKEKMKKDESR
jgi:hypothetical protein